MTPSSRNDPATVGIRHGDHVDQLHHGHMHHMRQDGTIEEHSVPVSDSNPENCSPVPAGQTHEATHKHGDGCGHHAVPHGDHTDYVVNGRLHHPHNGHCDDHGPVEIRVSQFFTMSRAARRHRSRPSRRG
jgi:hypothetical protein